MMGWCIILHSQLVRTAGQLLEHPLPVQQVHQAVILRQGHQVDIVTKNIFRENPEYRTN